MNWQYNACKQTTKNMTEAFHPLLQVSDSPRIVYISGTISKLKNISHERAEGVLGDAGNLIEDKLDEVLTEFLKDFKEGSAEAKGWPILSAYAFSKAAPALGI